MDLLVQTTMPVDLLETVIEGKRQLADGGELQLVSDFLPSKTHQGLFSTLEHGLQWEQSEIRIMGRVVKIPRLNAWYGDQNASYRYSGRDFTPLPWPTVLDRLRILVEQATGRRFNSVLANFYRDGRDSVAWHADDEPELGSNPFIASLSLGATRRFQLKHRREKNIPRIDIDLPDNTLLLMGGTLQHHWKHQLPKTRRVVGARINLTFRFIDHSR